MRKRNNKPKTEKEKLLNLLEESNKMLEDLLEESNKMLEASRVALMQSKIFAEVTDRLKQPQAKELLLQSQQVQKTIKKSKQEKESPDEQSDRLSKDRRYNCYTLEQTIRLAVSIDTVDYIAKRAAGLLSRLKINIGNDNVFYYGSEFFIPTQENTKLNAIFFWWNDTERHYKRISKKLAEQKALAFPIMWVSYKEVVNMAITPGVDFDYQKRALLSLVAAREKVADQKSKGREIGLDITRCTFLLTPKGKFTFSFD